MAKRGHLYHFKAFDDTLDKKFLVEKESLVPAPGPAPAPAPFSFNQSNCGSAPSPAAKVALIGSENASPAAAPFTFNRGTLGTAPSPAPEVGPIDGGSIVPAAASFSWNPSSLSPTPSAAPKVTADAVPDIYKWIRQAYRESRGAELAGIGVNPTILANLFHQQAQKWSKLSRDHVECIRMIVAAFNNMVLADVVADERIRSRLAERIADAAQLVDIAVATQLEALLEDEMKGILQTANHYYAETLSSIRTARVSYRLKKATGPAYSTGHISTTHSAILAAINLSNEDQAVIDIHDALCAYYKVSRKTFVDNVLKQVIEHHYLGPKGLVRFLTSEYIIGLSEGDLQDIAGDDFITTTEPESLEYKLERLQGALRLAERV